MTPEAIRRNPLLGLPEMAALQALPAEQRQALADLFQGIRREANAKAEDAWRRRKGPMAAYWRAVSTYAGHTARAVRPGRPVAAPVAEPGIPKARAKALASEAWQMSLRGKWQDLEYLLRQVDQEGA